MGSTIRFKGNRLDPATLRALAAGTLIQGNKLSAWWSQQSATFLDQFMREIRTSMQNGESVTQAITRITGGTLDGVQVPGIMKTTKGRAGALVATATNRVSNEAALASFQANKDVIKWITQLSTLDNRTSDICVAYSGQTWDIETLQPVNGSSLPFNGGPPRHFNCRSRLRPVTKSFQELGVDADEIPAGTRASMDGQVPADITFDQFLKSKGETFQNNLLGQGRADLWRRNQITLTELVDMRGNPLSLRQLEQRAGIRGADPTDVKGPARIQSMDDDKYVELFVGDEDLRKVFTTNRADKGDRLVMIHRDILEDGWSKTDGYIPPDLSSNTIGKRITGFEQFLKDNNVIRVGNVFVDPEDGRIAFGDGRHRARVLLNRGMTRIPVSMSDDSLRALQQHYRTSFATRKPLTEKEIARFKEMERQMEKARRDKFIADRERRRKAQEPPKVDSFLDDVQITQAELDEIKGHAKRLVKNAEEADDLVTQQIMDLSDDVGAKFPSAVIDDVDVPNGSLEFRMKNAESTARKIQTYARDRNLTYSEAADQISDSLRYTYIVDEDDYIDAITRTMERFAELGYKNGKFDPAWLKRPDYKGLNINMVTPQGVRMELQFHTARSFDVKQNINHALYEKFRKLSPSKQKGPEGQAIQEEMLANAQSIPVPRNINKLNDLAKTYDKPSAAKQQLILDQAELRKKRRADKAARKKEEDDRKAREAKDDDEVITDPAKVREAAYAFLRKEGIEERHFHVIDDMLELLEGSASVRFGAAQRTVLLDMIKPRVAQELRKEARRAASSKAPKVSTAPEFKSLKEAKEWFEKNLTNPDSQFPNPVGTSAFTGDKNAYRLTANVTLMMRDRFGLPLPNFAGMRSGHTIPFKRSSANAAVHMDSDSLLLIARGMKKQNRLEGAWSQYLRYNGHDGTPVKVGKETWAGVRVRAERDAIRKNLNDLLAKAKDEDLKRALKAALDDDDLTHTVGGMIRDADFMYWRTMVHENGHRLHGIHKDRVDSILKTIRGSGDYPSWVRATSKYAGANEREFLAEQFSTYMFGNQDRVHPLLKAFFEELDQGGEFGKALFKLHNKL